MLWIYVTHCMRFWAIAVSFSVVEDAVVTAAVILGGFDEEMVVSTVVEIIASVVLMDAK